MAETVTTVEYGVLYPDGSQDWKTASWFGSISEPRHRENFNEQYRLRLEAMGVPGMSVRFLKREVTTITSDTVEVFNNVEIIEPEPEPEVVPTPEPDDTIEPEAPEPEPEEPDTTPEEDIEDGTEPGTDPEPERQ